MTPVPIRTKKTSVLIAVVAVISLSACTVGPIGDADGELVIGTMLPLTGPDSEAGQAARLAVDERIGEIAAAAEFDDVRIRVVHTDVRSDSLLVEAALDELAGNNVDVIVGPPGSVQNDLTVTKLAGGPAVLHLPLSQTVTAQVSMMATAMVADGHEAVTLMLPAGSPNTVPQALSERLADLGGRLVSHVEFDPSAERFDPETALVAADDSTAVLIVGAPSPQILIDGLEAVEAGPTSRTVYLLGSGLDVRGGLGIRVVEPLASLSDRTSDRLVVAALAAARAKTDDPATLGSNIAGVVAGETVCSSFANCLSTIREVGDARFSGSGANGFTTDGAPTDVPYSLTAFNVDGEVNPEASRVISSG